MFKYFCLLERKSIDDEWSGVEYAFVWADDEESAAKRFIQHLIKENHYEELIDEDYWIYVIVNTAVYIDEVK